MRFLVPTGIPGDHPPRRPLIADTRTPDAGHVRVSGSVPRCKHWFTLNPLIALLLLLLLLYRMKGSERARD